MKDTMATISCQAWRRPDGPLDVWRIVEGHLKLEDGTTRPVKFSIQEVPKDRYEEAIDFMEKYFITDEPMNKAINMVNIPQAMDDLKMFWKYCLEQGISVAAYLLDSNNKISELVAFNMLFISSDETEKELAQLDEKIKSDKFKKIMNSMNKLTSMVNVQKIFGVDKYLAALGLAVSHKYRGQKLGLHLLEARTDIGKKYGILASSTVFTTPSSQILAERAGFQVEKIQDYSEILDDNGKPYFEGIESKDMRVMIKRLY